jgi:hypothetical protein
MQTSTLVNLINKNNYTFYPSQINGIESQPTLISVAIPKWEKARLLS